MKKDNVEYHCSENCNCHFLVIIVILLKHFYFCTYIFVLLLIHFCVFCGVPVNSIKKVGLLIYLYEHKTAWLNSKIVKPAKDANQHL